MKDDHTATQPINTPCPAVTASSFEHLQKLFHLRWKDVRYYKYKLFFYCNLQNKKAPSLQTVPYLRKQKHTRGKAYGDWRCCSSGHSNATVPYQSSVKGTTGAKLQPFRGSLTPFTSPALNSLFKSQQKL